jgi:hypothetical protein
MKLRTAVGLVLTRTEEVTGFKACRAHTILAVSAVSSRRGALVACCGHRSYCGSWMTTPSAGRTVECSTSRRSCSVVSDSGYRWPWRSSVKLTEVWPAARRPLSALRRRRSTAPPPCAEGRGCADPQGRLPWWPGPRSAPESWGPIEVIEVVRHDQVVSNDPEDDQVGAPGSLARGRGWQTRGG